MRYLTVTYFRKPNGQLDERVSPRRSLKLRDYTMASVILDFKNLEVIKARLEGHNIPLNFGNIVEYYHKHYSSLIQQMFEINGYQIEIIGESQNNPG